MFFWKNSGYFETGALDRPLLHTWSLAIEEQFYIVIPIALFLVVVYARRWTFALFALAAAVSLGLSIFMTDKAPTANFFVLPTRAWELLLGVLCRHRAVGLDLEPGCRARSSPSSGIGLIGFAVLTYTSATPFPGLAGLRCADLRARRRSSISARMASQLAGMQLSIRIPVVAIGLHLPIRFISCIGRSLRFHAIRAVA